MIDPTTGGAADRLSVRDIVRTAVVRTNHCWPFSGLNKLPYYLAISAFLQFCKGFPEIKSVYLRHGLLEDGWIPGISDVDLTLIIASDLTMEEEFSFLDAFWQGSDRLRRLFPMLQDIDILNDEDIGSWTKFTIRGYESRGWRLLHGVETVKSAYETVPARLAMDALDHSLYLYRHRLLPKFCQDGRRSCVYDHELHRSARKVLRYASYACPVSRHSLPERPRPLDTADTLARVIKGLEDGIGGIPPSGSVAGAASSAAPWLGDVGAATVASSDQVLAMRELTAGFEAIESIYLADNATIVVLKDGLDIAVTRDCADAVRRVVRRRDSTPVIVSMRMFEHMVRFENPFLYTRLTRYRILAYGRDVLPDVQPPDKRAFISSVLRQVINVLTYPRSRGLISSGRPDRLCRGVPDLMLERGLCIKLYVEAGMIESRQGDLLAETRRRYDDYYGRLRAIREQGDDPSDEASRRELVSLFGGLAREIHGHLRDGTGLAVS